MAENIYHLESKRVENSVFSQEMGGENGIFSKKCRNGSLIIIYINSSKNKKIQEFMSILDKSFKSFLSQGGVSVKNQKFTI